MTSSFFSPENPLKIGTRGSKLALAQANKVRSLLITAHGFQEDAVKITIIKTTGDVIQDRPLSEIGGKGLFTKEIEEALLDGRIDVAVHSSKDVATVLPDGLVLDVFLPREDVRDAFISKKVDVLDDLPKGTVIGSSSLRRQAQLKRYRSDLNVIIFRGNVQTRLKKLDDGLAEATLLASAGLNRLGMEDIVNHYLEIEAFLPACAQGAIGLERREEDENVGALLKCLHDEKTAHEVEAERLFLNILDGSCRTPLAGLAIVDGDRLSFRGEVLSPDGVESYKVAVSGEKTAAREIGRQAGEELKAQLSSDFLAMLSAR